MVGLKALHVYNICTLQFVNNFLKFTSLASGGNIHDKLECGETIFGFHLVNENNRKVESFRLHHHFARCECARREQASAFITTNDVNL